MSKLTKPQIKAHKEACELLKKDVLSFEEREFVLQNWQESATHINSDAGAFFTPLGLAWDFSIEASGGAAHRVIDLCAGIGALAFAVYHRNNSPEIVCVEKNPDYVAVGRKIVPEATWLCADVFEMPDLGRFDFAISNPPFGRGGPIKGIPLDLNVVAVAAKIADYGVFILPNMSVPFNLSGIHGHSRKESSAYQKLQQKTGIILSESCGIDCDVYAGNWRGVAPKVEIAIAEFEAPQTIAVNNAQFDLFGGAAE